MQQLWRLYQGLPDQLDLRQGGIVKIKADTCNECEDSDDGPKCQATCASGDACIVYM